MRNWIMFLFGFAMLASGSSCNQTPREQPLFLQQDVIPFVNTIPENDSVNILLFEYLYNGGGVGVGDFDHDGRPDLVFSGNLVSSALYLQTDDWAFTDVTDAAGLTTAVWCSGVNVADVDGNGWDDIYFATLNPSGANDVANLLFLNQGVNDDGIPLFREAAAEFHLDDPGYGTHSAWFDYENDGDLDLYVLNNAIESYNRNVAKGTDTMGRGKSTDRIYIRQGAPGTPQGLAPFFQPEDIKTEGWGLGLAVQDFNHDGFADLYVGNDFLSNDFLFINQAGEGFRDEIAERTDHQSRNAMGVDIADLNDDGHPEIMVVDMLPDDNLRQKSMFGDVPHQGHRTEVMRGYQPQFVRNTLQLNDGTGHFAEVAQLAGVAATDWSWTPLLADWDNDGDRDIFVSNGYPKDITNKDFIDFSDQSTRFGTRDNQLKVVTESLRELGGVHQPNYFFRNDGDLNFSPPAGEWLAQNPTYSNGAVFVDLDRDGDLDLVTNNINEPAGVLRNFSRERHPESSNFLQVRLTGPAGNPGALGTRIRIDYSKKSAFHEHYRQRGYLSTVDELVHFGLGKDSLIRSLTVRFPDGRTIVRNDLAANQLLDLKWRPDLPTTPLPVPRQRGKVVVTDAVHRESLYTDFDKIALAVRDNSRSGPDLAAIDLDGDGTDELIMAGGAGQPVTVWRQEKGALTQVQSLDETAGSEAVVLRVLNIGDQSRLYVGNGSTEFKDGDDRLRDLIYEVADGRLQLFTGTEAIPSLMTSAVVVLDGPKDVNPSLFVGSRMQPGRYPYSSASVVLEPTGGAWFPRQELSAGMVTAAAGGDFNGDGYDDLITAGEFTPVRFWAGGPDGLAPASDLPNSTGWYYSLTPADLDGDGDLDLLAGNLGQNAPFAASKQEPLVLLADDFDNNGAPDPILTAYNNGISRPLAPRNTLTRQLPSLKRQLTDFATYGNWTTNDLPGLSPAGIQLSATELRTLYLRNDGQGNFTPVPLPALAQTAPVQDAVALTLPNGQPALLAVQNDYAWEPLAGPRDAGRGFLLTISKQGKPEVRPLSIPLDVDARSIVALRDGRGGVVYAVGVNDGAVRLVF